MLRSILKSPGLPSIVVIVLALGIGANTALFSILDRVLLHPFPFRDLDRLVEIRGLSAKGRSVGIAPAEFEYLQPRVPSFDLMALWRWQSPLLTGVPDPQNVFGHEVGSGLFEMLGVAPALGRTFHAGDFQPSAPPVVVIGDRLWRQQFSAQPDIIGRQIILDGAGHTVVGVMGPEFIFIRPGDQVWTPLRKTAEQAGELHHGFNMIARIKTQTTFERAQQELKRVSRGMPARPGIPPGWHAHASLFAESSTGPYRRALTVLWCAVGLVLLIACANAANLLLARASQRRHEFALRASLGATRMRLARHLITESLWLGLAAGGIGIALASACLRAIVAAFPDALPQIDRISVNAPALGMTVALVMLTTLLCALPPCLDLLRSNLAEGLTAMSRSASSNRSANRVRSALIAFEIALSVVLLAGAGLMLRSLSHLFDVHLGFEPQQVLTAHVPAPPHLKDKSAQVAYYGRMLDEARALPGVWSAAINTVMPFGHLAATTSFSAEGSQIPVDRWRSEGFSVHLRSISPGYFSTMGIRLLQGRPFLATDGQGAAPVAIVNDTLARRYWPGEDPIGKRVSRSDAPKPSEWQTVVGLVESTQRRDLASKPEAEVYLPYTQYLIGSQYTTLLVRAKGDPMSLARSLRTRIHDLNPEQPIAEVKTMEAWVRDATAEPRFHTVLFEIFAGLALALAASGVFAVVSYAVTQRTREIGIRSALGATPIDILRFVLRLGMVPVFIGACAGTAGALAATPLLKSQLFETAPAEPAVFVAVLAVLLGTAVCAAALPAWRATRVGYALACP